MSIMYFVPVIAIVLALVYVVWYQIAVRKAVAAGHGPILFHNTYAGIFPSFAPNEYTVALWQGLAYTGSQGLAAQVGGAVLNEISSKAVGVSTYTPQVHVVLTSFGRVIVAEEYSEQGRRGNYREVRLWPLGATAITGPTAIPTHRGPSPSNPFNPMVPLELARLLGPDGSVYACWLSPQSLEVTGQQRAISSVLPISAEQAGATWQGAVAQAAPRAA